MIIELNDGFLQRIGDFRYWAFYVLQSWWIVSRQRVLETTSSYPTQLLCHQLTHIFAMGNSMKTRHESHAPKVCEVPGMEYAYASGETDTPLMLQTLSSSVNSNSGINGQLSLNRMRILVVDDDRNTLEVLSELLGSYHADVRTADSAATAIMLYQSWAPELLISDLGMPDVDGYDLIRNIHALPDGLLRKAIALTGFSRDEDRDRALAAGYDIFLTKPVEVKQLISLIAEINQS